MRLIGCTILSVLWLGANARADGLTAQTLYEICHDQRSPEWQVAGQWLCPTYIRGIIDGARLQSLHEHGPGEIGTRAVPFCEPADASPSAAIATVMSFIEARPERRPLSAAVIVFEALNAAWRCPL